MSRNQTMAFFSPWRERGEMWMWYVKCGFEAKLDNLRISNEWFHGCSFFVKSFFCSFLLNVYLSRYLLTLMRGIDRWCVSVCMCRNIHLLMLLRIRCIQLACSPIRYLRLMMVPLIQLLGGGYYLHRMAGEPPRAFKPHIFHHVLSVLSAAQHTIKPGTVPSVWLLLGASQCQFFERFFFFAVVLKSAKSRSSHRNIFRLFDIVPQPLKYVISFETYWRFIEIFGPR